MATSLSLINTQENIPEASNQLSYTQLKQAGVWENQYQSGQMNYENYAKNLASLYVPVGQPGNTGTLADALNILNQSTAAKSIFTPPGTEEETPQSTIPLSQAIAFLPEAQQEAILNMVQAGASQLEVSNYLDNIGLNANDPRYYQIILAVPLSNVPVSEEVRGGETPTLTPEIEGVTGWKPDFTQENPYEGMPTEYATLVSESYVPTEENPLSPLQEAALIGQIPLYESVNVLSEEQKKFINANTLQEYVDKVLEANKLSGEERFKSYQKIGLIPKDVIYIPSQDDESIRYITQSELDAIKEKSPDLYALLITKGIEEYNDAIQVELDEVASFDDWKPDFTQDDPYADIPQNMIDKYFVKLDSGEYILNMDFKKLNPYQQQQLKTLGIEKWNEQQKTNKEYLEKLIQENNMVINGKMMPLDEFNKIPEKYQDIALARGYDAMYEAINSDEKSQNDALGIMKSYSGVYDAETEQYDVAKFLSKGGAESVAIAAGFEDALEEAKKYNYDTRGIGVPSKSEQPTEQQFILDYLKEKGTPARTLTQLEAGNAKIVAELTKQVDEARQAYWDKYLPHVSLEDYVKNYFEDKDWEYKGVLTSDNASMKGEYTTRYLKAENDYQQKYGKSAAVKSQISKYTPFLFAPSRAIAPEVRIRDISGMEFAMGGAQIALMSTPLISTAGRFGGLISKGVEGGATALFGTHIAKNWNHLSPIDRIIGVGGLLLPMAIGLGGKVITRTKPGTITGEALSLSEDVARPIVPEGMSSMAARQLMDDVERLNLKGTIPANELRALDGVPNLSEVSIIRRRGIADVTIKSMDGNIVFHASGSQRIFPDVIYSAVPDLETFLMQAREFGIKAVREEALAINDTKTLAILDEIVKKELVNKGFVALKKGADKETLAVLKKIYDKRGIAIKNLGEQAHYGFFASPQAAQTFMYDINGTPSPGIIAIRLANGELKELPKSVLDSATLAEMRAKMEALASQGKLESGIYPLYKGYRDAAGNLRLEYELYSTEPTILRIPDSTWYARGEIPTSKVSSLVGFDAPTATSRGVRVGDSVPMYWFSSEKALIEGKGIPSVGDFYASKMMGDLTLLRKYAPWNLRFDRELASEAGVFTNNIVNSSFKQIRFEELPTDITAGRTSAIIRNSNGDILLVRQKGQKRYDLPGGGVPKIKTTLREAMAREVYEETGLQVKNLEFIDTLYSMFNPKEKLRRFQIYDVDVIGKPTPGAEIAEIIWWDGKSKLNYPVAEFAKGGKILSETKTKVRDADFVDAIIENIIKKAKDKDGNIDLNLVRKELKELSDSMSDDINRMLKNDEFVLPYKPDKRIETVKLSKLLGYETEFMGEFPDLYGRDYYAFDIPKENSIVYSDEILSDYQPIINEYVVTKASDIKELEPQEEYEPTIAEEGLAYPYIEPEISPKYKPIEIEPEVEPKVEYEPTVDITPTEYKPVGKIPIEEEISEYKPPTEYVPPYVEPPTTYRPPVEEPPTVTPPPPTIEKPSVIALPDIPASVLDDKGNIKRGVIEWRQGKAWAVLPPKEDGTYDEEDTIYLGKPLPGTTKFAVGKGSAYKTLQVIGGMPQKDSDVDMGWADIHISVKDGNLTMNFKGGKEAIESRWAMERENMDELDRQSYDELPEEPVVVPIKRGRRYKEEEQLNKTFLPEYSNEEVKVYSVNSEYIRNKYAGKLIGDRLGVGWDGSGHHYIYWKLIPEDEIWVSEKFSPDDQKASVIRNIEEREKMSEGMSYTRAHDKYAKPMEIEARKNIDDIDEILERQLAKYNEDSEDIAEARRQVRKVRQQDESALPNRYYLGRKLRPVSLGINI